MVANRKSTSFLRLVAPGRQADTRPRLRSARIRRCGRRRCDRTTLRQRRRLRRVTASFGTVNPPGHGPASRERNLTAKTRRSRRAQEAGKTARCQVSLIPPAQKPQRECTLRRHPFMLALKLRTNDGGPKRQLSRIPTLSELTLFQLR